MRREDHRDRFAGDVGQGLLNFRRVTVRADAVGRNTFVALREMRVQFGRAAGTADAALAVDNDRRQVDVCLPATSGAKPRIAVCG